MKKHYHWVIAAVALLQLLIYGGAVNNFSSFHVVPVTEALGISRTAFSLAGSLQGAVGVLSILMAGVLIQRIGYRRMVAIGLSACAAAYVLFSLMNSYWMLILGCSMVGLASGICTTSSVSLLLNRWFHKYRGTVLGIVSTATSLGSSLLGPIQAHAIDNVSWRLSFVIVAALQVLIALIVFLLVRNKPEDMGLKPLGFGEQTVTKKKTSPQWVGFTMQELKKQPGFYMLAVCALLTVFAVSSTSYNIVPYFRDCGMTATRASRLYSIMMLILSGVKLLAGVLCDAIGAKRVAVICQLSCATGVALLLLLPQTDIAMIAALIVFDFAMPATTLLFPLLSVELFGYQAQNQFMGVIMAMTSASTILSGPISNFIYDTVGSYVPVFLCSITVALMLVIAYLILFGIVKKGRAALEASQNT